MKDSSDNVCPNGHRQPHPDSKFCTKCGVPIDRPKPARPVNDFLNNPEFNRPAPGSGARTSASGDAGPRSAAAGTASCGTCGGDGGSLPGDLPVCGECSWLRPLADGYRLDPAAFLWAEDGRAMSALRNVKTLRSAARTISDRVGRRWIEVTFNGVLLGDEQMPEIYREAVLAARILGLDRMPDIYLSGERMWDCLTFGSDRDSFVVIGSALAGNFRGEEMRFLLAREMGHCRAGHALWKTVIQFFLGEQGPKKGFMAGGVFSALSPTALIGGAIEMPLLAWARQAEITADRAGLLAVSEEETARKVLLSWSLKSAYLYRRINVGAWLEQQAGSDDEFLRLSELTTTSTPYITRRLQLLADFAAAPELKRRQARISELVDRVAGGSLNKTGAANIVRVKCAGCRTPMKIPFAAFRGKKRLPVRCPNKNCRKINRIERNVGSRAGPAQEKTAETLRRNMDHAE